jgi:hypothetical protein
MYSTPKKTTKRAPKPEESVNDYCRICKTSFKVEFGGSKSSFENLFKPSQRKENKGLILAVASLQSDRRVESLPKALLKATSCLPLLALDLDLKTKYLACEYQKDGC